MKKIECLLIVLFCVLYVNAQDKVISLYDGLAPGSEGWKQKEMEINDLFGSERYVVNVVNPTLTFYLPSKGLATGSAMVICPGGGYRMLSIDSEGTNVAKWFADHGIAAFVLKYRLVGTGATRDEVKKNIMTMFDAVEGTGETQKESAKKFAAQEEETAKVYELSGNDGRKAIEYVRQHAVEFGIDPDKIGIIGFSAGSSVTLNVCFNHSEASKPNLVVPVYGSMDVPGLPKDAAPLFVVAPQFDVFKTATTGLNLYKMWHAAKLPAEAHYFAGASHGFGLKSDGAAVNVWIELLYNFMQEVGFLNTSITL